MIESYGKYTLQNAFQYYTTSRKAKMPVGDAPK